MRTPATPLRRLSPVLAALALLSASGLGQVGPPAAGWPCYGGDPMHTAVSPTASVTPGQIRWSAPVDLQPQYSGDALLIHYGTPIATAANTIVFPVKTGTAAGFRADARAGATGAPLWSLDTDYEMPEHNWAMPCGICLDASGRVVLPGIGGTVLLRSSPDSAVGNVERVAFYGTSRHDDDPSDYDETVRINTPITADSNGNLFFGFVADAGAPRRLKSGIARIGANGKGRWIAARKAARDSNAEKVAHNCAPALSPDGRTLYVAVNDVEGSGFGSGWLVALDSRTLARRGRVRLRDHFNPDDSAALSDDGTASPTVGPDGDVYFGVVSTYNNFRGWMLHFDRKLRSAGPAGGFGWDDTPSIVPRAAVPGYAGSSDYLLLTKSNDYVQAGGDGINRLAVIDPGDTMIDPWTGATVMKEILTVVGPTPDAEYVGDGHPDAVREWCINTAAVDVAGRCAIVNNEDGILYRWDFATNTLNASVALTAGVGEAYTPTIIGPDGAVYAINDATLFCVEELP